VQQCRRGAGDQRTEGGTQSRAPVEAVVMDSKWCPHCKTTKSTSDFYTRTVNGHIDLQGWCKECMAARHDRWDKEHPGRSRRLQRRAVLRQYGLSIHDYDVLCQRQGNRCAICRQERPLVVDHDHQTGRVRGLLCDACNWALGHMEDDPERLRRAIDYLGSTEDHRASRPFDLGDAG
jgi:hypothetical protein